MRFSSLKFDIQIFMKQTLYKVLIGGCQDISCCSEPKTKLYKGQLEFSVAAPKIAVLTPLIIAFLSSKSSKTYHA